MAGSVVRIEGPVDGARLASTIAGIGPSDVVELVGEFRANLVLTQACRIRGDDARLRPADPERPAILVQSANVTIEGLDVSTEPHLADVVRVEGGSLRLVRSRIAGGRCGLRCEDARIEITQSYVGTHECSQSRLGASGRVIAGCEDDDDGRAQISGGSLDVDGATIEGGVFGIAARDSVADVRRARFLRNRWTGLSLTSCKNSSVVSNEFVECGMSIELHEVVKAELSSNTVRTSSRRGIDVNDSDGVGQEIAIVGNQVLQTEEQAIMITGAGPVRIEGNRIVGGWNGVMARDGASVTIKGNEISDVKDAAIQFSGASRCVLGPNDIDAGLAVALDLGDEDETLSDADVRARIDAANALLDSAVELFGDEMVEAR